ncbi:MAG: LON peptidase substrate-binding domain-containing protein [Verrucomicrobiales bacterium]|nr:LON peptidase substrate-binding domain-containing protein [Verrucomicrobiales bacterium]
MPVAEQIELPDYLPAIVLSGCTIFPHCLQPLFIFEERYRNMLTYSLEKDRMFCVATTPPGVDPDEKPESIFPITTAGLIRAAVEHDNGTTHLTLLGLRRVRVLEWDHSMDFRLGRIEPVVCQDGNTDEALQLATDLTDLTRELSGEGQPMSERVLAHLRGVKDASAIADVVAHNFITDPMEKQQFLEMENVPRRLTLLIERMRELILEDQSGTEF